jgi:hypothetical protein
MRQLELEVINFGHGCAGAFERLSCRRSRVAV